MLISCGRHQQSWCPRPRGRQTAHSAANGGTLTNGLHRRHRTPLSDRMV